MVVGLTGGIGSGKTIVLNFFKEIGVSCYIADVEAKHLMNTSVEIKNEVIALLGEEAYTAKGLNRNFIADIVFNNRDILEQLNAIVHPRVFEDFIKFVESSIVDYIIYESAIILNGDSKKLCDKIIVVTSPLKTRIERVMKRDDVSEQSVLERINKQMSEKEMLAHSDFVINNISLESTKNRVESINAKILLEIQNA